MPSHEMIQYLMEQRHLQQSDLVELLGSRSQVSLLVNGKRSISKGQAKKLAEFFHVSADQAADEPLFLSMRRCRIVVA